MKQTLYLGLCVATAALAADVKLPAPYHTPSATNRPNVVARPEGAQLRVPEGFQVEEFSSAVEKPRIMIEAPGGQILVAEYLPKNGRVSVIAGKGAEKKVLLENLDRPYGMTIWKDYLYVTEGTSIKRYKFDAKALTVGKGEEIIPMPDFGKGHMTHSLTFDPKGQKLYVGVGSEGDFVLDPHPKRAAIWRCNPDGSDCSIFASGLRNPTSTYFHPGTNTLWATVQERDGLGDDLCPDFFTTVKEGGFYGWPYAYYGPNEDPRAKGKQPELVKKTITPEVSLGAHSAVIDWKFYTGKQFPAKYKNGAFLALHGSSNRSKRTGYSVVFIPFKNGKPAGPAEDFLTGFMADADSKDVWGRPTGVTVLKDGSMLVSEDGGSKIYRISYKK
jgi:glucose/arabinose dehydrogenase